MAIKDIRNLRTNLVICLVISILLLTWVTQNNNNRSNNHRTTANFFTSGNESPVIRLSGKLAAKESLTGTQDLEADSVVHAQLLAAETALSTGLDVDKTNLTGAVSDSTVIVFNLFKGPVENLESQLMKACTQSAEISHVWVLAFNSPSEAQYRSAVESTQSEGHPCRVKEIHVSLTASSFNFKFHGRFLLAPMASTVARYLMMVDDDVVMTTTMVQEFIAHMKVKPRLLGTAGQLRGPRPDSEPGWHNHESTHVQKSSLTSANQPHVDYLCNIWFLKTSWTTAVFNRDHPLTFYTGEDIHLSFMVKKYLGVDSAVVNLAPEGSGIPPMKLAEKKHSANHEKRVAHVRNDMFRLNLARGFVPVLGGVSGNMASDKTNKKAKKSSIRIGNLVFVQNERVARVALGEALHHATGGFFSGSETATCMLFTGREKSVEAVRSLHETAIAFGKISGCELYLRPKWGFQPRPIQYLNMRLGLGIDNGEYPIWTALSDMIPAIANMAGGGIDGLERVYVVTEAGCAEGELYRGAVSLAIDVANQSVAPGQQKVEVVSVEVDF
ncbi:hypothetical protein BJ741DRAFT_605578 [Chytriomyces cf. hyalinus JEL632]|nr:hypothetical protein BJ741DRAFT_605578 [Chytriomyces cf. hyalinus JEL632]